MSYDLYVEEFRRTGDQVRLVLEFSDARDRKRSDQLVKSQARGEVEDWFNRNIEGADLEIVGTPRIESRTREKAVVIVQVKDISKRDSTRPETQPGKYFT